jgi:hypothetical protein
MRLWNSLRVRVLGYFSNPLRNRLAIIQPAIGAFSITKTVLSLHGGIDIGGNDGDDEEKQDDYAAFLPLMEQLCRDMDIPPVGLADYRELLELWQRDIGPRDAISYADVERARGLSARYVNWVYDFFPGFQRTLQPGHAILTLGSDDSDEGESIDAPRGEPGPGGDGGSAPVSGGSVALPEQLRPPPGDDSVQPSRRRKKPRSVDVVLTAAAMWMFTVGLLWIRPGLPPGFQLVVAIAAVYTLIVGILIFVGFRWSPEMMLLFYLAAAGSTTYFMAINGIRVRSLATLAFELYGLWMYRDLHRQIRG